MCCRGPRRCGFLLRRLRGRRLFCCFPRRRGFLGRLLGRRGLLGGFRRARRRRLRRFRRHRYPRLIGIFDIKRIDDRLFQRFLVQDPTGTAAHRAGSACQLCLLHGV